MAATRKVSAAPARITVMATTRGRKPGTSAKVLARFDHLDTLVKGATVAIDRPKGESLVHAYDGFVLDEQFVTGCKSGLPGIVAKWAALRGLTVSVHTEQTSDGPIKVLEVK